MSSITYGSTNYATFGMLPILTLTILYAQHLSTFSPEGLIHFLNPILSPLLITLMHQKGTWRPTGPDIFLSKRGLTGYRWLRSTNSNFRSQYGTVQYISSKVLDEKAPFSRKPFSTNLHMQARLHGLSLSDVRIQQQRMDVGFN